jgi:hypothetical protein
MVSTSLYLHYILLFLFRKREESAVEKQMKNGDAHPVAQGKNIEIVEKFLGFLLTFSKNCV